MRKIKFRALAPKVDGKWHYGSLLENTQQDFDSYIVEDDETKALIDRETVGQHTGLKDKNGKEIYEGDLVKHEYDIKPYTVYFKEDRGGYSPFANDGGCGCCCDCDCTCVEDIEVIGNIYDNPELLNK